jgi:2-C-methyl-D-erythritol 4-phosphate cytidylyltransferase
MFDFEDEDRTAVGWVPVDGRGSLPYALLHGESLVAVASWALGDAGVDLLDFTISWSDVRAHGSAVVIHDPLCPGTPTAFLAESLAAAVERDVVVVGVRPVTDTVKTIERQRVGDTVDRSALQAVTSPVVLPASVVAALPTAPAADIDLADLVTALVDALGDAHEVVFLEAPPEGRRVSDESDLRLVEALAGDSR